MHGEPHSPGSSSRFSLPPSSSSSASAPPSPADRPSSPSPLPPRSSSRSSAPRPRKPISKSTLIDDWRHFFSDAFRHDATAPPPVVPVQSPLPTPLFSPSNLPCGDPFSCPPPHSFRLWSNNVNGISSTDGFAALHSLCVALSGSSVSAIALQEPNLDFTQTWIRDSFQAIFREHFGRARVVTATTCIPSPSSWKPGGVALIILGPWADAVVRNESDDLGRWCSATFPASDDSEFTILTAYNCVKTTLAQTGRSTVFAQQWRLLRLSGILLPDPRRQFITDLTTDLRRRRNNGETLLLTGDFNECIGLDPLLMASITSAFTLADPHSTFHGEACDVPTYIRGTRRLDYCLLDSCLLDFVSSCGINRFNEFVRSDHRALFLDLSLRPFLRSSPPPISAVSSRSIGTQSPDIAQFVACTFRHLDSNNAFEQFAELSRTASTQSQPWVMANKIDTLLGQALSLAEKRCSKHPRPPWSANLYRASLHVRYWYTVLSARRTRVDHDAVLLSMSTELWPSGQTPPIPSNLRALESRARAARRALRRIRRTALHERRLFLEELRERIALRTKTQGTTRQAALANVTRQLNDTQRFSRIRKSLNPAQHSPLTKVEVVRESVHLHPITGKRVVHRNALLVDTKQELESSIIARNKRHFAQASGTPFTRPPLSFISHRNNFNLYEDAAGIPIHVPADCFVETHTIMDILRSHARSPPPSWSPEVDFDTFVAALLHWREATSTSPSRRHLGLYKALLTAHINASSEFTRPPADAPDGPSLQTCAERILRLIHGLGALATVHGFFLKRWIQVVNVMIYKKPGCIELDRLRVIHLFEADFNLFVGVLFGRRAMHHQVSRGLLHSGQYGRPGGDCQDPALSKVLHNLISFYTKTPLAQFESDATACFDRVVMNFSLASFRVMGAPSGPLRMWERTLQHIVHRVKTAYGVTTSSYAYEDSSPILGPGQGSRGGPAACATATSPLLEAMDALGHGVHFCDPAQQLHYHKTVNMFIDDATNATNDFLRWLHEPPHPATVIERLRHDAQTWE